MQQLNNYKERLAHHLKAASQPQNLGDALIGRDYIILGLVTIVVPAILLVIGWQL